MTLAGLSPIGLGLIGFIFVAVTLGLGYAVVSWRELKEEKRDSDDPVSGIEGATAEAYTDGGHVVDLRQPQVKNSGLPVTLWKLWRHHRKKKKIGEKGYVQWYLINDTLPEPKFVKPEMKGGDMLEYEHDGATYLFPREAMVPDEQTGMWTAVHKEGDAMPINIETPGRPAVGAGMLKKYLELRVSSSPPSFLDQFDITMQKAFWGLIMLIIAFAVVSEVMA